MVFATLFAACGLLVSALGTLKTNAVADNQLEQSRQEEQSRTRRQVALITFSPRASKYAFVVANRSLDPASAWLSVDMSGAANGPGSSQYYPLGILPPCQSAEISNLGVTKGAGPWPITKLLIVDANGKAWVRTPSGILQPTERPEQIPDSVTEADGENFGPYSTPVKWANITPCGDPNQ
jgi:hypothetical protein